jgi:hypothetical protein
MHDSETPLFGYRYVYMLHTSFDGSFQLFRKDKIYDRWDTCLTDGCKYFIESKEFNLEAAPSQGSTRISSFAICTTGFHEFRRMPPVTITAQ